jgi:hypothetical protein
MLNSLSKIATRAKKAGLGAGGNGGGGDPYANNVSVLLNMNGTNASTTFTDSSSNSLSFTSYGGAQISTAQSKFGGASGYFDGDADIRMSAANSLFNFGTGDFTIECFLRITGDSLQGSTSFFNNIRSAIIASCFPTGGNALNGWVFGISGNTTTTGTGFTFQNWVNATSYETAVTTTLSKNTWYHIAAARSGTVTRIFLDGVLQASNTLGVQNITNNNLPLKIGRLQFNYFNSIFLDGGLVGYIDDLRITKGVARYTSSFTPPSAEF